MKTVLILNFEVTPGADIDITLSEALVIAFKLNCIVSFSFNGVKCLVRPNDSVSELRERCFNKLKTQAELK